MNGTDAMSSANPQLARRVVGRIGADHDQGFDAAVCTVVCQCAQRTRVPSRNRIDRRDEIDRRAERMIDPVAKRVHVGAAGAVRPAPWRRRARADKIGGGDLAN